MEELLPLLIWGGLFFLMMRFGCGSHMFGQGHDRGHGRGHSGGHEHSGRTETPARKSEEVVWTAPEKDTDPVCGKDVSTASAKSSVYSGWVYYFCSRECREMFELSPETYLGEKGRGSL